MSLIMCIFRLNLTGLTIFVGSRLAIITSRFGLLVSVREDIESIESVVVQE